MRYFFLFFFLTLFFLPSLSGCDSSKKKAAREKAKKEIAAVTPSLKALNKVKAATEVGVNFQEFGRLLIEAKTSANESSEKIEDPSVKRELLDATEAYTDSLTVWQQTVKGFAYMTKTSSPGNVLIAKYQLPTIIDQTDKIEKAVLDDSLKQLWEIGQARLQKLNKKVAELEAIASS